MWYGLEQHKTDGYKSPHTISPALMKRELTDFVQFLHPAPAEEIFKDPLWVKIFPLSLLVWEAQNGCLKYSGVACKRTFFRNSLLGYCLAHTGDDYWVHYFYHIMLHCHEVVQPEHKGDKSCSDWLKLMASGSNKFLIVHLLLFLRTVYSQCETLPWEREILNK